MTQGRVGQPRPPIWRRVSLRLRWPAGVLAMCAMVLLMSSCGGHRESGQGANLAAVIQPLENPFFAVMRDGLVATAKRHRAGISVRAALALQDTAGQASALESLVGGGADCYIIDPIDESNLIPPLTGVTAPIINLESPVDPSAARAAGVRITTYISIDNMAAGRMAAQAMAGRVGKRARVAIIAGVPGDVGSMARTRGFVEEARGRFTVVTTVAADFDRTQAQDAATELLRGSTHIDGIFAVNDEMALGVVDAARTRGQDANLSVIGVDGIPEALTAIRRGRLSATVAQFPFTIGQLGVEACLAAKRGREVPATVRVPIQLITQRNVTRAQLQPSRPLQPFEDPLASLLAG